MLTGRAIVCFAPDPWRDLWRNRHRLLTILARSSRILYVEPRVRLRTLYRKLKTRELGLRSFFARSVEEVRENLLVHHDPLYLPRIEGKGIGPWIDRLRFALLNRTLRNLRIERPILWLVRPDCWDVPGRLGECLVLYQVVDDYLTYQGLTDRARSRIDSEERRLASQADLVVVTSEHLLETKRHLAKDIVLVQNGVDERTLEEGTRPIGALPPELASRQGPILGYIGGITEKLDFELLEKLAVRWKERGGTLALVGSTNVQGKEAVNSIQRLHSMQNVVFTGRKDAADVPAYVRAFDVCLVPYKVGPQTLAIDPLKLYEYLAFGKPTVCVAIPSVRRFKEVLWMAGGHEEFFAHVEAAVGEKNEDLAARRRAIARENSWEARAEQLSAAIEGALARKGSENDR